MNIDSIIKQEYKRIKERGTYGIPNHYVINISDEDQKDEFLYELTSIMSAEKLRPFHALDRWLYFSLDGSKENLLTHRGIIESSTVFDNYFEGVLAFDATALLLPVNRNAKEEFYKMVSAKEISHHSTIIIFLNDMSSEFALDFLSGLAKHLSFSNVELSHNKLRLIT